MQKKGLHIDFNKLLAETSQEDDDELEKEAKKELSFIHSGIPYLPLVPALICCAGNVMCPGSGCWPCCHKSV